MSNYIIYFRRKPLKESSKNDLRTSIQRKFFLNNNSKHVPPVCSVLNADRDLEAKNPLLISFSLSNINCKLDIIKVQLNNLIKSERKFAQNVNGTIESNSKIGLLNCMHKKVNLIKINL